MTVRIYLIFILLGAFLPRTNVCAATKEERLFNAGVVNLQAKLYELADQDFEKFLTEYPESTNRADAILHRAQARYHLGNHQGALGILQNNLAQAGELASDYQFWIAQTFLKSGKFREAADAFAELGSRFPQSPYQLEGAFKQALAEAEAGNRSRVIELLQTENGQFRGAAKAQPNNPFAISGTLLLGESLLKESRYDEAEQAIAQPDDASISPDARWQRDHLLCRIRLAAGRMDAALEASTNLLASAQATGKPTLLARSLLLRGEILEKAGLPREAMQAYEQNLTEAAITNAPPEVRRQTFFKAVDLDLAQGELTNAIVRLESFLQRNPADGAIDLAQVTLGELRLRQFAGGATGANISTNLLASALTNFNAVITQFPQSAHLGRAYLGRGWCGWLSDDFSSAEKDFAEAVARLPLSEDRAVARFKLADTQFRQANFPAAVTNYQALISNNSQFSRVTNSLFEPALYQLVRASLKTGNDAVATNAMHQLIHWFPNGSFGDRGLLLLSQSFNRVGKGSEARALLTEYLERFPGSPQGAEIRLAIAQTYVEEQNWGAALAEYDQWVTNHTGHALRPQGEFARALVFDKAGQETNAYMAFTNFVTQFPSNQLAALAQNWVADFYWNRQDYRNAEKSYQELFQRYSAAPELSYRARLMAGRSAYDRANYREAKIYFGDLISLLDKDTNAPPLLTSEALFALGDTYYQEFIASTNSDVSEAIKIFTRITNEPGNPLAPLAWGRIGECYFQMGGRDSAQAAVSYKKAADALGLVMNATNATVAARSEAEVCLGNVCVKQAELRTGADRKAWLDAALRHYMNVVTLQNLRDGDAFDPKWVYEAGLGAARVCETSGQWEQARNIYELLARRLPPLRDLLEKKMVAAKARL